VKGRAKTVLALVPFLALVAVHMANIRRDPPANLTRSVMPFSDEGLWVSDARNVALFGRARVVGADCSRFMYETRYFSPLKHGMDVVVFSLFGVGFAQARAVALAAFFASTFLIFYAVSRARGFVGGYFAALVFGASWALGMYFRLAAGYSLGMFFVAASLALVGPVLAGRCTGRIRWRFLLGGAFLAGSLLCKAVYYGVAPGALVALAIMDWRDGRLRGALRGRAVTFLLGIMAALVAALAVTGFSEMWGAYTGIPAATQYEIHFAGYTSRLWGLLEQTWSRMGLALALFSFCLVRIAFRRTRLEGFMLALAVGEVAFACLKAYTPQRHFLAAWGLMAAMGGMAIADAASLVRSAAGKHPAVCVAGALVGLVLVVSTASYVRWLGTSGYALVEASERTGRLVGHDDDKLLFGNMAPALGMENRVRTLGLLGTLTVDALERILDDFNVTHLANVDKPAYLPEGFYDSSLFNGRLRKIETFRLGDFDTTLYEVTSRAGGKLHGAPPVGSPSDAAERESL